jgi:hypothetical protein
MAQLTYHHEERGQHSRSDALRALCLANTGSHLKISYVVVLRCISLTSQEEITFSYLDSDEGKDAKIFSSQSICNRTGCDIRGQCLPLLLPVQAYKS